MEANQNYVFLKFLFRFLWKDCSSNTVCVRGFESHLLRGFAIFEFFVSLPLIVWKL